MGIKSYFNETIKTKGFLIGLVENDKRLGTKTILNNPIKANFDTVSIYHLVSSNYKLCLKKKQHKRDK